MKLKYCRMLIVVTLVCAIGAQASAQTKTRDNVSLRLGNQTILVPSPEGLQEVSGNFPTVTATFEASEPPQNELLASYVADSDHELLQRAERPLMHYYAKISTLKAGRGQHVSSALFNGVVAEFRKHTDEFVDPDQPSIKKLIENMERHLSESRSVEANLEIGKPKNLGAFNISADTYSILLLSAVNLEVGGQKFGRMVLAGASLVHVRNRILFVNCYRTYESETDLETMKDSVSKWTKSILAANRK